MILKDYSNSYIQDCVPNRKTELFLFQRKYLIKKKESINDSRSVGKETRDIKIFFFWGGGLCQKLYERIERCLLSALFLTLYNYFHSTGRVT